jgi:hypothetical protein
MIGTPIKNTRGRETIALELASEVVATHLVLHAGWTIDLTFPKFRLQAQNVNKLFNIKALAALMTIC